MDFVACNGDCTEEGTHCEGCGRSHEEIAELKTHVGGLVAFAQKMKYGNSDVFVDSVANTIKHKLEDAN
ncbi:MAG: DUF1289 domain-containing protein [Candidatus Latescibacteria bacterium]|jgi:hypothetical protein|nr:DUF1289 domain-containing protein [Gemmatimonadaceae bacterium]MDP6015673.1 DUF1289 domain-containing protein [Candidatus Latescibacterota bacterium]MDP7449012.1 DUF1289 domain-containing protein [Candidatus Latescibacterota bacterium]HJP30022.1 DUF1289 domain-containing protein [Candidatus Latescibacterota bacterium]